MNNNNKEITPLLSSQSQLPSSSSSSSSSLPIEIEKTKTLGENFLDFLMYGPQSSNIKKKGITNWYDAWDIGSNTKEIFIRSREGDLAFLDGIRALAYLWVLSDHMEQAFTMELTGFEDWWRNQSSESIKITDGNKGDQGVTSFFFLSGFLIPFIFSKMVSGARKTLKENEKEPAFSYHAFEFLFRRYMRLAPTLMTGTIVALLYGYLIQNYSTNSYQQFFVTCNSFWWENALFINNINGIIGIPDCYDSVWTISCEFQLYILTIPVVYFYCWKAEYGYIAVAVFTALSFTLRVLMTYMVTVNHNYSWGGYVYLPSWTRAAEYGVGAITFMIYDYYFSSPKQKAQIQPIHSLEKLELLKRISFYVCIFFFLVFGLFYLLADETWWSFSYYQYESFSYFLWALTLFAVSILAIENVLWPVKWFLSWYVWYPIAQLAYTGGVLNMVICHATAVASIMAFDGDEWSSDTSLWTYMFFYFSIVLTSLTFGYILSLLIERPFMNIAKMCPPFYKVFGSTEAKEEIIA